MNCTEQITFAVCLQREICILHSQAQIEDNKEAISEIRFIYSYIADYISCSLQDDEKAEDHLIGVKERLLAIFQDEKRALELLETARREGREFAATLQLR